MLRGIPELSKTIGNIPIGFDIRNSKEDRKVTNTMNRREFLETASVSAAGFTILPRHVLGGTGLSLPVTRSRLLTSAQARRVFARCRD